MTGVCVCWTYWPLMCASVRFFDIQSQQSAYCTTTYSRSYMQYTRDQRHTHAVLDEWVWQLLRMCATAKRQRLFCYARRSGVRVFSHQFWCSLQMQILIAVYCCVLLYIAVFVCICRFGIFFFTFLQLLNMDVMPMCSAAIVKKRKLSLYIGIKWKRNNNSNHKRT